MGKTIQNVNEKFTIWYCEDAEEEWRDIQDRMLSKHNLGGSANIIFFESAGHAYKFGVGSPDIIIIDVGGMMSMGCDVVRMAVCNIEGLSEMHPGAIFIVVSAMSHLTQAVMEDLSPELQSVTRIMDTDQTDDICNCIKEFMLP